MQLTHAKTFGGGIADTALNPVVLAVLILAALLILALPRKYVTLPLLFMIFLVPSGQAVVISGAHFYISRIIVLIGMLRFLGSGMAKGKVLAGGYNLVDSAFLWCTIVQAVAVVFLFKETSAFINQVALLIDYLGAYFLLRFLIQDEEDINRTLKFLAVISAVLAVTMIIEQIKLVNVFYYVGGGQATPDMRDGKIRSQGAFQHTLLAGTFGATLLPLFILLLQKGRSKVLGIVGIVAATAITLTSNSSSPVLAFLGGLLALCLWPMREKMRLIRWSMVAAVLGLAAVMKAPVWFIIAHIDLTGSSSGYHRAELIDQFVRHFSDWWLMGVKDTGLWGWDMWDAQNQYVNVGETGGLAAFILFMTLMSRSYSMLGKTRRGVAGDEYQEWFLWCLGAALFSHLVAFFGVNYFDQSKVNWFLLLAFICTARVTASRPQQAEESAADVVPADDRLALATQNAATGEWWKRPDGSRGDFDVAAWAAKR